MNANEIRSLLYAEPFRPFLIHVADSGRLLVKHPDFVALAPSGFELIVYRHDRPGEFQVVDLALVSRLEVPAKNGTRRSAR